MRSVFLFGYPLAMPLFIPESQNFHRLRYIEGLQTPPAQGRV